MPEKTADSPAAGAKSGKGKASRDSGRAKSSRAKQGHFLTARERDVLRTGPKLVQTTRREYESRSLDRDRRDLASDHARAKRKALASAQAALEDLTFLASVMDSEWLYELATHLDPPPGVSLEIAQGFQMEATLPRLLEHLTEKVGNERAPEVEPMVDTVLSTKEGVVWLQDPPKGQQVKLRRAGASLLALWLAGMERGLNAPEQGRQVHTLSHSIRAPTPPPLGDARPTRKGRRKLPRGAKPGKAPA